MSTLIWNIHTLTNYKSRLPRQIRQSIRAMLRSGDVLINRKEYAVTNYFLPGYWPHAVLYLGEIEEFQHLAFTCANK